jgi:tetratricopeptide (TPR) repeat protein
MHPPCRFQATFVSVTDPTHQAALAAAVQNHRAGRLREAIIAYESLLQRAPNDADVLQLLGVALAQLGRHADGATFLARSLELKPDRPSVWLNLAQALLTTGRAEEALQACDRAIALDRALAGGYRTKAAALGALGRSEEALANAGQAVRLAMKDPGAHADLGAALVAVGREREALECFDRAIAMAPNLAPAHFNRALLLGRLGDHARALQSYDRAIALQPQHAALHSNRGNTLKDLGRLQDAAQSYSLALAIEPRNAETLHNRAVALSLLGQHAEALRDYDALRALGKEATPDLVGRGAALVALGRYAEALDPLDRAVELLPGEAEAHVQRGVALLNLERNSEAVESFDRALALRPNVSQVLTNRGIALTALGRLSEALETFIDASVREGSADTNTNLGIVLKSLGRHREAAESFGRALDMMPRDPSAKFALAFLYLTLGKFNLGWPLYEARFDVPALRNPPRRFDAPRWTGTEPLTGKTLLVYAEQGLGDVIQFCRYLPLLESQGATVVFEVMPNLMALLRTLPGSLRMIPRGDALPPVDYTIALLSLPLAYNTQLESIPGDTPYLAAEPDRVARWAPRLQGLPGLKIGIAWQGNLAVEKLVWARGRSMPLTALEPLARMPGVSLVALQKGPGLDQLRSVSFADRIVELGAAFDSGPDAFLDTAAVMAGLDLVITTDTSIAHLAGALGRPVWTALALSPEWRWLLGRADSPWYPGMRLFRQTTDGDWSTVVAAMVEALSSLA